MAAKEAEKSCAFNLAPATDDYVSLTAPPVGTVRCVCKDWLNDFHSSIKFDVSSSGGFSNFDEWALKSRPKRSIIVLFNQKKSFQRLRLEFLKSYKHTYIQCHF